MAGPTGLQAGPFPKATLLVIATVDLTSGRYRNAPGRLSNRLSRSEAAAIIDHYQWHGILQRGATGGWELPDSDYRKKKRSDYLKIGLAVSVPNVSMEHLT